MRTTDIQANALAASVECMTEAELQLLAAVTPGTLESWRKRGQGPAYVRFGTRYLYPRAGVRAFIAERAKAPVTVPARTQL